MSIVNINKLLNKLSRKEKYIQKGRFCLELEREKICFAGFVGFKGNFMAIFKNLKEKRICAEDDMMMIFGLL